MDKGLVSKVAHTRGNLSAEHETQLGKLILLWGIRTEEQLNIIITKDALKYYSIINEMR